MTLSVFVMFSAGCSKDDNGAKDVKPPVNEGYEKAIMKEWVFTAYQLLDKDRNVLKDYDPLDKFECKNNKWIFKTEVNENNEKNNVRIDLSYLKDPETEECIEHKKTVPYSIKDNELATVVLNDGDQMMPYFFEIREISSDRMLIIRKDYVLTEEEAIQEGFPKEARYLQYLFKAVK